MSTNPYFSKRSELAAVQVIKALESRHFEAYFCSNKQEAVEKALSLIPEQASVTWGGSESIKEIGLLDAVKKGTYSVFDRDEARSPEERNQIMRHAFNCDWYLMSTNAITQDGQLVNVDGNGNRVAALTFGPANVLVIVGMNKLCKSHEDALIRARTYAAPLNTQRVFAQRGETVPTPCTVTGICGDCKSAQCICNSIVTTRHCSTKGRIKIILVGESLGF